MYARLSYKHPHVTTAINTIDRSRSDPITTKMTASLHPLTPTPTPLHHPGCLPAGSLKVWDFGAGQVIKSKAGRGTDEDLSITGLLYQRFQQDDHIIVASGWTNKIRLLVVSVTFVVSPYIVGLPTGKTNTSFGDCFLIDQRGQRKQSPKLVFVLPVGLPTYFGPLSLKAQSALGTLISSSTYFGLRSHLRRH